MFLVFVMGFIAMLDAKAKLQALRARFAEALAEE